MNTAPAPSSVDASRCVSSLVPMNRETRREVEDVRGRVAALGVLLPEELVAGGVDEAEALGDQVRLPVVVGGVAVEPDAVVDHVEDAPRERGEGDRAQSDPEAFGAVQRAACPRKSDGRPAAT